MAEKDELHCEPIVPKENALTDSETDALKIYPKPPEDVGVSPPRARVDVDGGKPDKGYIYVLREEENGEPTGLYKVGSSGNPDERRGKLQTGNYRHLKLTKTTNQVDNMVVAEAAVHHALKAYHKQLPGGGTEWYRVTLDQEGKFYDDLDKAIDQHLQSDSPLKK